MVIAGYRRAAAICVAQLRHRISIRCARVPRFGLKSAMRSIATPATAANATSLHITTRQLVLCEWLDASMTYSSGLLFAPFESLDDAQAAKIERVLELLDLRGGERVLEIGCGWGSLAERLLGKHDCSVTGVTLSAEQLDYARRRPTPTSQAAAANCYTATIATSRARSTVSSPSR